MRVVLDTNVVMSGLFFAGPPSQILAAWRDGRFGMVLSPEILDEYMQVGVILASQYPEIDPHPFLRLLVRETHMVEPPPLREQVCSDSDDDKFWACAIAGDAEMIVSGDKQLQKVSGYENIKVLSPRSLLDRYLS